MLKNRIIYIFVIISLLSFFTKDVFAYEYTNETNKKTIEQMINEVYDSKELYEQLSGKVMDDEEIIEEEASSDYYWWPIGSSKVNESNGKKFASDDPETISITSNFGNRLDPFGSGQTVFHSGIDINGGSGLGSVNIIAARDGTVVYSSKDGEVCTSGSQQSTCGGGYGNYIIIQHTDGNYTLYAHLYENSLTVSQGESVRQGQVIAKMGSSGNSTGAHLHFEVREGQNDYSSAVDPLNYVDPDNPRPANTSTELIRWIENFEGHTTIVGDNYLIEDIGDGVSTVGPGVVLEYNGDRFKAHGVDVSNYHVGDTLPISLVDTIKDEVISETKSSIQSRLANNGVTLKDYQLNALVSYEFNCGAGAVNEFIRKYKIYGMTDELYNSTMANYIHVYGEVWAGLVRRRRAEWHLFTTGEYTDGWEFM